MHDPECYRLNRTGRCSALFALFLFVMLTLCLHPERVCAATAQCTVKLIDRQGQVVKKTKLSSGRVLRLPAVEDEQKYTFLGWDTKAGKGNNPRYIAGQTIRISRDLTLYGVYFKNDTEKNPGKTQITRLNRSKYSALILVGSSSVERTGKIMNGLDRQYCSLRDEYFLGKGGLRLSGFRNNSYANAGEQDLLALINKLSTKRGKPVAVVFALGRNDFYTGSTEAFASAYADYLDALAVRMAKYNVRLFFESIWPVNEAICKNRLQRRVLEFNEQMREFLPEDYTYIDMFTWMVKNGYSFRDAVGAKDDGLHFSSRTYKRMHDQRVRFLNKMT